MNYHTLPFGLLNYAVAYVVSRINMIRHSDTTSTIMSPREQFIGRRTDFKIDLSISFGDYVETDAGITDNSLHERTESCIALFPTGNQNGSVKFFSIKTQRIITRERWRVMNMNESVIKDINLIALRHKKIIADTLRVERTVPENFHLAFTTLQLEDDITQFPSPFPSPFSSTLTSFEFSVKLVEYEMCWFGLVGQMMQKCLRIRGLSPSVSQLRSFSIIHTGFSSVDAELHFGLFPAVKLAGLPFNSSPTDIANFLNGLKPVDIVVQFRSGESTGNLAILFKDAEDAAEALKLNRKYIGQRYVTVMRCRRDEYFHIVAQDLAARRPKYPTRDFKLAAAAIRIEGLSYEALPFDVYRFCSKFIPREDYVKICATSEGLSTGVAYVEMRDLETAKLAQETLHHKFIGIRKVTVALASPQEASLPPNKFFT